MRVDPELKELAENAALKEHRTLTNWIEALILDRCEQMKVIASNFGKHRS